MASDRNRLQLQAGLLQQGFGQAQQAAQQNFMNQMGLASALPGLQRADVSTLGQLGALDRGLAQGQLDADREAARMSAFQPQEQVDRYATFAPPSAVTDSLPLPAKPFFNREPTNSRDGATPSIAEYTSS